jgi:HSP20 family protein
MTLLTRRFPFGLLEGEMARFRNEMNELFGPWGFGMRGWPTLAVTYPPVNIWENEEFIYVQAELPGMKLEDLEITVTGNAQLTIKGKRRPMPTVEKVEWHRQERGFGPFGRTILLPIPVVPDKVEAHLENGVLIIKMAKIPAAKPRHIPVHPG